MTEQSPLSRLSIAAPCSANWNEMSGDDRTRMCSLCNKNVYNISAMSRKEADSFLNERGSSACVRFYRRHDGTIITENCPVGLRRLRNAWRSASKCAASLIALIFTSTLALAKQVRELPSIKHLTNGGSAHSRCATGEKGWWCRPPGCGCSGSHRAKIVSSIYRSTHSQLTSVEPRQNQTIMGSVKILKAGEAQMLPSYHELTTGSLCFSESEIYQKDSQIYLRTGDCKRADRYGHLLGRAVDTQLDKDMTAQIAFSRAKTCDRLRHYNDAALFYQLTVKYISIYKKYDDSFQQDVWKHYKRLLLAKHHAEQHLQAKISQN